MEYNKQQFQKTANKKILHKVKKHWVVLSTALLVALAGSATLLGGTSVHAEADDSNEGATNSSQSDALKSRINASLVRGAQQNIQNHANDARIQNSNPSDISKQASTLHNRILANAASGLHTSNSSHQANQSAIGRTSSVKPVSLGNDADQVQFHNIPVTVKYLDSAGKLQKDQNNRPRVGTAYVSLAGDPNASGQLSMNDKSNSYLYNGNYNKGSVTSADSGYSYASGDQPSNFTASINGLGTKYSALKLNNSTLQPEDYSDTNVSFGDNWDSTNNRPLFVLKAEDPNQFSISDQPVTVKFVNSDGTIQETNKYDDSYSGDDSYDGQQVTGKNHPKIITAYADLAGDPGGTAHFVVDPNVVNSASKAYLNNDPQYILYNQSDFSPVTSGYSYMSGDRPSDFSALMTKDGYQYQEPANGQSETYSDANIKPGDNWDSTNNRPMFILKAGNARNIFVNYINEKDYPVREPNTNYNISGKGRYGDSLNVWDPSRGGAAIPYSKDYQLDSDTTHHEYTFNESPYDNSPRVVTVPLNGKRFVPNNRNYQKDNAKYQKDNRKIDNNYNYLTVNVYAKANAKNQNGKHYYVKSDGSLSSSPVVYKRISKYIPGQIGNFTNIDPHASWLTSQLKGYNPAPGQSDMQVYFDNDMDSDGNGINDGYGIMGTIDNGHFKKLNNQSIDFTYDAGQYTGTATNINLTYINQNRKVVGKKTLIGNNKDYGRKINVTKASDGGLNVPSGYTLDSGQLVDYVFNGEKNGQTVTLTVHGNSVMTNHQIKLNNKKSIDQNPLAITLERDYYSSDGRTFEGKSDAATVHPNIYGEVGNSAGIIPSSFLSYVDREGANVEPLVDRPQKITFNGNGTVTPNKFTLKYKVIPIRSKRSTIRIHYVSVNPDGTDNMNGVDIPNTEVSDNNFANYSFGVQTKSGNYTGDSYYRLNVPKGYQFDKILKINGEAVNNKSDVAGITHFADHDQDEVIEVVPNAGDMTIHYIDQSNHPIYTETESGFGQATGEAPGHTSRYGELFPVYQTKNDISPVDANEVITPQGHVLANYHISQESAGHYFTRDPQNVYVMVAGNQAPDYSSKYTANIHIHEENPNGVVTNSYTVPDQISGDIGDSYTVNADSYTPDNYRIAPGTDSSVTGMITPRGISKRSIDFYYMNNNDQTYKDLKGIDVIYEDDQHQVGFNQINPQPNDYQGEDIDVTTRGNDGYQLPSGYQLDPDQNTHSSFGVNSYNQLILQVYRPENQVQGNLTVIQRLYRNSTARNNLIKTVYKTVPEAGAVGDTFNIDPKNYEVNGFSETSSDSTVTGKFTPQGISPATAEFYYVATDSKNNGNHSNHGNQPSHPSDNGPIGPVSPTTAEPIYVQYYQGEGTSNPVGNDVRVDGYMGQNFSDITKSVPVPKGYYLIQGQNLSYTIGDQERQVDLHVNKANSQARNFPLTIKLESPSDNIIGQRTQNIIVNGNSSDEITPSDYNPDSVNFHLDTSQHRDQDINIVNQNGELTPSQATYYYIANSRHHNPNPNQPSDVNIQPITVNYINRSDGKNVQSYTLSDGYMDQKVNVTANNLAPVPDHFHLNPENQNVEYTFGNRPQTANLLVSGNQNESGRDDLVVDSTLIHADGEVTQGIPDNITLQSQYGGQVVFNPQELIDSGYLPSNYHLISSKIDSSDAPQIVHFNDNGTITPSTLHFTYEQDRTNPSPGQAAGLLEVNYINQNNQRVGGGLISGHKIGDVISNIASSKDGGIDVPYNYNIDSTKRQDLNYKFTINDAVRNIYVVGKQDNTVKNMLDVHLIEIHNDGSQTTHDVYKPMNYDVGDDITVYPNEFTPNGYYVNPADEPAQISINNDDTITPKKISYLYNQETNSDAGDITVSYYNQMGQRIGNPDVISGRHNNNKTINVTDPNPYTNDMVIGDAVPNGYHLVSGQQTEYQFGINPQNVQLRIQGDPVNSDTNMNQLTIHVNERSSDSTTSKIVSSKTYREHIHENVGSDQTISPNQYLPSADKYSAKGYHVDSSDQVANIIMNADHSIRPNQITWNYSPNNDEAQPLTLSYIDVQTGKRVGCITRIDGYIGQTVPNVTHESDGGGAVPAGYTLLNNQDQTIDPQTHKPYVLGNKAQNVQLKVEGNVQNVPFIVHEVLSDGEGDIKLNTVDYRLPANVDRVGDTAVVTPNTKGVTPNPSDNPNGYQVAPSDKNTSVRVHVNNGSLSPSCALFHYVLPADRQKAGPISVSFINQIGQQVGDTQTITGHINQKVNVLFRNGDPKQPSLIPAGYHLAPGTDVSEYNRIMSKNPQYVIVQVQGDERQASFTVYVTKLDLHGNRMGNTETVPLSLKNHRVGSDVQISPYMGHLTPSGYHADSSDASFKVQINNNGTCSPVDSVNYNYTLNYLPPLLGRINVHYVTSQGAPQNSSSEVDVVSDHGISGDRFNLAPYQEDMPDTVEKGYHATGNVYDRNGNRYDVSDIRFDGEQERDIYIQVAPNSATDMQNSTGNAIDNNK